MVSADIWSSETEFKLEELVPGQLVALWSGDTSEALELISIYRKHLSDLDIADIDVGDLGDTLSIPLKTFKRRKAEHLVGMQLGLTYQDFIAKGERLEKMDKPFISKILEDIRGISVSTSFLIAGLFPHELYEQAALNPCIFRMRFDKVEPIHHFACIGDGTDAAELALHRREQNESNGLLTTLYNVYEAKKLSELARSVGSHTALGVMEPATGKQPQGVKRRRLYCIRHVSPDCLMFLDRQYKKYGPRKLPEGLTLPDGVSLF